jgi:hypothetical protein
MKNVQSIQSGRRQASKNAHHMKIRMGWEARTVEYGRGLLLSVTLTSTK